MSYVHIIMQRISEGSIAIPLIAALLLFTRLDRSSQLVLIILVFAAVPQFTSSSAPQHEKNLFYNIYTMIDLLLWGIVFLYNIPQRLGRILILLGVSGFLFVSMFAYSRESISGRFLNELVCFDSLLQVFFILMYFLTLYWNDRQLALERQPFFWFALGLLIYAPVTYFHFAFYGQVSRQLQIIHNVVNTGMYLLFTIGMLRNMPQPSKAAV